MLSSPVMRVLNNSPLIFNSPLTYLFANVKNEILLTLGQISRLHSITDTVMLEKSGEDFSQGLHVMKRKWLRMYSGS